MTSFILQILIMASLGTLIYLVAKTIPRIDDTAPKELLFREHWVTRKVERIDKKIKTSSEKLLRRLGILLLKWENKINKKVTHLKEESAKEASDILTIEERPREETPEKTPEEKEDAETPPRVKRRGKRIKNDPPTTNMEGENSSS